MAKKSAKTRLFGLRVGHPTQFRRTVTIGSKGAETKVQLVFEPGKFQELTEQEIAGLQREIDGGLIVEWGTDPKGRHRANEIRPLKKPKDDSAPPEVVSADEELVDSEVD